MNYAFYITGHSKRLIDFLKRNYKIDEIKIIVSDTELDEETRSVITLSGIQSIIFDRYNSGSCNKERNLKFSDFLNDILLENNIDYMFSLGEHILSGKLLLNFKNRIINFHPAILPMFPGLNAIDQAMNSEKNVFLVGNTAHFVDEGVDTGKIIMQSVVPLESFMREKDYNVVLNIIDEMLVKLINVIDEDRLQVIDGKPIIKGADYNRYGIYPLV